MSTPMEQVMLRISRRTEVIPLLNTIIHNTDASEYVSTYHKVSE
ncbi:hypothetical protein Poly41_40050 [Novipirellula artificiosorum]|uniref:Uncharacterized protein n=1 Tax=Novipirellula artificiosorum TaxID=2528016 RepID=A0A5C6DDN8_9BACT|nr:hypothetical protein Poly41_40050 [Novipirellula artificiosorum]